MISGWASNIPLLAASGKIASQMVKQTIWSSKIAHSFQKMPIRTVMPRHSESEGFIAAVEFAKVGMQWLGFFLQFAHVLYEVQDNSRVLCCGHSWNFTCKDNMLETKTLYQKPMWVRQFLFAQAKTLSGILKSQMDWFGRKIARCQSFHKPTSVASVKLLLCWLMANK